MRREVAIVIVLASALGVGCASTAKVAKDLAAGSCQQKCADENPNSLYDQNRCLETLCSPP